jgi:selenophosphate synthetase-related protein
VHPRFNINFDSTSFKESSVLLKQLRCMPILGERKLVTAGKDISNPGLLGTLAMILETSNVGAVVELDRIPVPEGLKLIEWLKMYPGMGFIVTSPPDKVKEAEGVFIEGGLCAAAIGKVTKNRKLVIRSSSGMDEGSPAKAEEAVLFEFEKDAVTGIKMV